MEWLLSELTGKRPLMPPALATSPEVADVLNTFKVRVCMSVTACRKPLTEALLSAQCCPSAVRGW